MTVTGLSLSQQTNKLSNICTNVTGLSSNVTISNQYVFTAKMSRMLFSKGERRLYLL
jgi:hypothetical protein